MVLKVDQVQVDLHSVGAESSHAQVTMRMSPIVFRLQLTLFPNLL